MEEVNNVTIDVEEALDQPQDVVVVVNPVNGRLVHLNEANALEIQRVVREEVQYQREI